MQHIAIFPHCFWLHNSRLQQFPTLLTSGVSRCQPSVASQGRNQNNDDSTTWSRVFLILWDKKTEPRSARNIWCATVSFFPLVGSILMTGMRSKTSSRSLKGAFPVGGNWWNHRWGLDLGYFWILRTYLDPHIHLLAVCFFSPLLKVLKWKKIQIYPKGGCLKDDSSGHDWCHDWCHDVQGCIMMKRKQEDFQADWHMW